MTQQIKVGQWWENGRGDRLFILAVADNVPGMYKRTYPVIAVNEGGGVTSFDAAGYNVTNPPRVSQENLAKLLPPECNSFGWQPKPEAKYRPATAADVTFPWKQVWIKDPDFYTIDQTYMSCYLAGVYTDAEGKTWFTTTDGKTRSEVFVKLP